MQKALIIIGALLIVIGITWPWIAKLPLGRLPGDIIISKPHLKIFFPITTMIIVSIILSIIMWLLKKQNLFYEINRLLLIVIFFRNPLIFRSIFQAVLITFFSIPHYLPADSPNDRYFTGAKRQTREKKSHFVHPIVGILRPDVIDLH